MVGEVGDICRLEAEVLEGLGLRIDDLVVELTLNLIGRHDGPPKGLVQDTGDRLEDLLGHIHVAPPLVDFAVNHLGDLSGSVGLGTVELKSLRSSVVVPEHLFKSLANINHLKRLSDAIVRAQRVVSGVEDVREQGCTSLASHWMSGYS